MHEGRDDADVADQPQEAQVDIRQSGPGERAIGEQVLEDEVVHGNRDDLYDNNREPQPDGRLDTLGDGEERAHAQEKGEREVFDERGLHEEACIGFHQNTSVRWTS